MQFEFATVSKITFGSGKLNSVCDLINGFGQRALIISSVPLDLGNRLLHLLELSGIEHKLLKIRGEPTVDLVREVVSLARETNPEVVIGIGGGSAIDMAKTTSAMLTNPGDVSDYLEVIGENKPLKFPSLPLIAIPTTSGTGSEVTRNAVIGSTLHQVKVSLRSPFLLPRIALIDPELTVSVPPPITAITGLDALTQLIEPFTCINPNPLTDAICLEGIRRVANSLLQSYDNGGDIHARENMSLAALFSGLALANAKLGAVHGLAGPIGGLITAPHGAICASLLPNVLSINIATLQSNSPESPILARYATIGKLLNGDSPPAPESLVSWIINICLHFGIKPLSSFGLAESQFDTIIEKSQQSSSMKGNPIKLYPAELRSILRMSM
jgi:alcohol dehydrogenase class IV